MSLGACVTLPPDSKRVPQDPWESWNRGVYNVNDKLDHAIARPVARTYVRIVPQVMRTGVSNIFENMRQTTVMINDALQGKLLASLNDLGRFVVNSTFGLAGIFDPATKMGIAHNNEDFGQTLGVWGVPPGPFFVLPVLGPSDVRDGPARLVDALTNPHWYIKDPYWQWGLYTLDLIDTRAGLLSLDPTLKNVYDPYAFIRDAYLQRRAYLVADGKVPDEAPLVDPGDDDPANDTAKPPAPPAAPPDSSPPQTPSGGSAPPTSQ
jgi:phospholipid-binding lipoprotein MlaA